MTDVEPETPLPVQAANAPALQLPRLALSESLYSSFNPYATLSADTTGSSQPTVDSQAPSQEKDSQEKASDEESVGKKVIADQEDEEVFKRPFPVNRSTSAAPGGQSESGDGSQKESSDEKEEDGEGEWFSDLPDPGLPEGAPRQQVHKTKKLKDRVPPPPRSPTSGDEQADEIGNAKSLQLSKAHRLIREQYRRPTNQPPLPPSALPPEEVIPSVQQRSRFIFEEKKRQLASVGLRGPLPHPSPSIPGLSADSVDDVASANAADESFHAHAAKDDDTAHDVELIISPPMLPSRRKPTAPLLPPPTTQELEAESERQLVENSATSQATPGNVVRLHIMPTMPSQDDAPPTVSGNPLAQTTLIPMSSRTSSLSASQLSQMTNDLDESAAPTVVVTMSAAEQAKALAETRTEDLVKGLTEVAPDDPEVADILAAVGVELPPEIKEQKTKKDKQKAAKAQQSKSGGDIESAEDFSDGEDDGQTSKKKKKKKARRLKTGDEEVLGDSNDEMPSSEEDGDELVSEERSESSEALRPLSSDDDEDELLDPADPQTLFKLQEDEAFTAGIAAMQARLAAKKAEKLAPIQRRKRKGIEEDGEEEEGEGGESAEEEIAAKIPVPDEEMPSIARLERGDAGSEEEGVVPIKPPAPRDDPKRRRILSSSSLLDEPDAKEVLAAMRPAGSFRQAPQALRLRKGTSFIADKAQSATSSVAASTHSSSSSLSASASFSLSHSGFVFGRDSGGAGKTKPIAAAPAAATPAAAKATDPRKRQQRPSGAAPAPLTKKGSTLLSVLSQNFFDSKDS